MGEKAKNKINSADIFKEYEECCSYKSKIGDKGLYEQSKKNERFYAGDQWYGANVGNSRPLVRHNIIKRIADYKISVVNSSQITVNFSAEGVPSTVKENEKFDSALDSYAMGQLPKGMSNNDNINLICQALTDYQKTESERIGFDKVLYKALLKAYVSGTGIVYTYWDDTVNTGLYADKGHNTAIKGDIACEVIDVENMCYGDPTQSDIQKQPFVIIAQRKSVEELKREAKKNGIKQEDIEKIKSDNEITHMAGDRAEIEPSELNKAILLTKFYKEYDESGNCTVMCVKCVENAVIKEPFDIGIKAYPLADFKWIERDNCAYGESEVTYLIPNQIAINRMYTANVWAVMMMGMPMLLVNGDVIGKGFSNNPGQVIKFSGSPEEFGNAISYVNPPQFSGNFLTSATELVNSTLQQSGANDSALGDVRPDNTSAILAVREASTMPLAPFKNRYYQFVEEVMRIWGQFWVNKFGDRQLKITDSRGTYYIPFEADKFKDLIISVKVDVGASTIWSESVAIQNLDAWLEAGIIDQVEYLERFPKGLVNDVQGLIKTRGGANMGGQFAFKDVVAGLSPKEQQEFLNLPPEQQKMLAQQLMEGGVTNEPTTSL